MPNDERKKSNAELDDFWDIERLLPEKKSRPVPLRSRPAPTAVELELEPSMSSPASADGGAVRAIPLTYTPETAPAPRPAPRTENAFSANTHYVPPHSADEEKEATAPLLDYSPEGVLLHRVRVYGWASNFHYFDQFAKDAVDFAGRSAPEEARKESFFSYFPQYVQMNRRQAAWYLLWREETKKGKYLDTDYAYILLYIFELINLDADGETAARHRDALASVWMAYRRTYPQLDRYMCEWLCDYCLIHRLPAPLDILAPALDAIIGESRLKEFYLVAVITVTDAPSDREPDGRNLATARILMRHCCQYDYRKSKFAEGEHKALFDKTIPAAVASVLPLLLGGNGHPPAITMQDSTVSRDAYVGALCSYRHKRRITVSYTSFSRSHDLRFLIGDMVKHVENRLRSWIGVRSRLSVMSLPIPLRDALDAYLNPLAPPKAPMPVKKKEVARPAYEALYDLPEKPLSLIDADAIEQGSWETTRILTEAFGGEEVLTEPIPQAPTPDAAATVLQREMPVPPAAENISPLADALGDLLPFLRAAIKGDRAAERAYADSVHKMPDAIADEINAVTAACEIFDMVLTDDGSGFYAVIEDYRDILQSM